MAAIVITFVSKYATTNTYYTILSYLILSYLYVCIITLCQYDPRIIISFLLCICLLHHVTLSLENEFHFGNLELVNGFLVPFVSDAISNNFYASNWAFLDLLSLFVANVYAVLLKVNGEIVFLECKSHVSWWYQNAKKTVFILFHLYVLW